jgi:coenzyme F420-0:L-glutamate ligase / coenzyme F420-1:gamma-L-glutamate ligase
LEVSSNPALHRVGARARIARVMISWGVLAVGQALIQGEASLAVLRFLLGVAEAGFFPGIILCLTPRTAAATPSACSWRPSRCRPRSAHRGATGGDEGRRGTDRRLGYRRPVMADPNAVVSVIPVVGLPEIAAGADLAELLAGALNRSGLVPATGDCLVVSSKVVSKALDLGWPGDKADAVAAQSVRVVAERRGPTGITRVVEAVAGPVMAAAGVDSSNTGAAQALLVLPADPDAEARRLRAALLTHWSPAPGAFGVLLSDTAGRPWRDGQTDIAIGAAGLRVLDDLRGGIDADGRPLAVTARAVADEIAAAADLVKGKADAVPAALVRGLPASWFTEHPAGSGEPYTARSLVRTGPGDWFAFGHVEAVRAALGVPPGSAAAAEVGIPLAGADEPIAARVARAVGLTLRTVPGGGADLDPPRLDPGRSGATVTLTAPTEFDLGRLVARLEVAASAESLRSAVTGRGPSSVTVTLS